MSVGLSKIAPKSQCSLSKVLRIFENSTSQIRWLEIKCCIYYTSCASPQGRRENWRGAGQIFSGGPLTSVFLSQSPESVTQLDLSQPACGATVWGPQFQKCSDQFKKPIYLILGSRSQVGALLRWGPGEIPSPPPPPLRRPWFSVQCNCEISCIFYFVPD